MTALTEKELTNFLSGIEVYDQGGRRWVKEYLDPPRVMDRGFWWVEQVMREVSNSCLLIQKYGPITMNPPVDSDIDALIEAEFDELIAKAKSVESVKTSAEVIHTDPVTGAQKGRKPVQIGAVDPKAIMALGEVAGYGANKYSTFNYLSGFPYSWSYDALQRHLNQFWDGEDLDTGEGGSGLPHLAHAAWHCMALLSFYLRERGTDDRPHTVLRMSEGYVPPEASNV